MVVFTKLRLLNSIINARKMSVLIEKTKLHPVDFSKANAKKDEILFHLYTKSATDSLVITETTVQTIQLDKTLETKVFIHGWNSSIHKGNWYNGFKEAYLKKGDFNVLYVDWFTPGSQEFPISAANVKPVGYFIGDFLLASKIPLEKIHVIGKSLGSHVASFVGKRIFELTSKKIARITGLDPAGPKFEHPNMNEEQRLCKKDAEFVDVIHTDGGYYGFINPIGTVDFYPNGGKDQPGCGNDDNGHNDSHGRSNWYFLESINSKSFIARKAESWQKYLEGRYDDNEGVIFGEDVPKDVKGNYYFETNSKYPYAKL